MLIDLVFITDLLKNEIIFIIFILLLLWLGWKIRKAWLNMIFFFSKRKGRKGEYKAIKLLEKDGYEILNVQNKLAGRFRFNNQSLEYVVRPDFLVRKNGVKYFAEVKTGNAAEINNINTLS